MRACVRLYDEAVDIYERVHYSQGEDEEEVRDILSWYRKPGARVLDLGCGTGLQSVSLAKKGFTVVGVDKSEMALKAAREKADGLAGVRFVRSDLETDPLTAYGVHDLVLCIGNTISHLTRPRIAVLFDSLRRALAPGGVLLFNAVYWANPFQKNVVERDPSGEINVIWERRLNEDKGTVELKGHFIRENYTESIEVQCYKAPELLNLLRLAGFTNVRWSHRLDFQGRSLAGANTIYYKAVMPKRGAAA